MLLFKDIGEKRVKIGVCCLFTSCFVLTENRTTRGVSVCLSVYSKSVSSLLNVEFIKNDYDRTMNERAVSLCHPVCSMSVSSLKNVQCLRFFPYQNLSRLICLVDDFF